MESIIAGARNSRELIQSVLRIYADTISSESHHADYIASEIVDNMLGQSSSDNHPEIRVLKFSMGDISYFKGELFKIVMDTNASTHTRHFACFLYSKLANQLDIPNLRALLRQLINIDMAMAYNVMWALKRLGEEIWQHNCSAADEIEENRECALYYLKNFDK